MLVKPRERAVIVSVHDVAPANLAGFRWLLGRLDELNVQPRSLLVIPCEGGQDDLRHCPELVDLLHEEVRRGSEIVLHGYTHQRAGPWRGSLATRVRAALFAREAAEFASLSWPDQRARLLAGRQLLHELGFEVRGFCPPAWLSTPDLPDLLRELGFRYLVEMLWVHDLKFCRRLPTPWLGYLGSRPLDERLVQVGAALLHPWRERAAAVSVFLHPQGAAGSPACARVLRELARLLSERKPVTYGELLER
jgi:predicted deacetylase